MRRYVVISVVLAVSAIGHNFGAKPTGGEAFMTVIDRSGKEVILPVEVDEFVGFSADGISPVRFPNGQTAVIDKSGKLLFGTGRDRLTLFANGMSTYQDPITSLWGVYSSNGNRVLNPLYRWISPYCDGFAIGFKSEGNGAFVLDTNGDIVAEIANDRIALDFGPPCQKLIPFRDNATHLYGFVGFDSRIVIPAEFEAVSSFRNQLARVSVVTISGLRIGFINGLGEFVIEPRYPIDEDMLSESTDFNEGLAFVPSRVSTQKKVALNSGGTELFEVKAYSIGSMVEGRAAFFDVDLEKWGFINLHGEVEIAPIYDRVADFGAGLAVVSRNQF